MEQQQAKQLFKDLFGAEAEDFCPVPGESGGPAPDFPTGAGWGAFQPLAHCRGAGAGMPGDPGEAAGRPER